MNDTSSRGRPVRTYDCADCGTRVTRKRGSHQRLLCFDCSISNLGKAGRQLAAKNGPYYDKWVAGVQRYAAELADGGRAS